MKLSLRQLARSRRLRAMGVLAWLMLVVNVVAAAPMGMHAMAGADAMEATSAVIDVHCHDAASMPMAAGNNAGCADRKSVVWGKSVSVRVGLGGRRIIKKNKTRINA